MTEDLPSAAHTIADFVKGYEEENVLRGFHCPQCGLTTATWGLVCPRCGNSQREERRLSGRGKVASFTVLTVPGDDFLNDAPYAYVVIELDEGGRVTGWMPAVKQEGDLAIGDPVHFVPGYKPGVQFVRDADGTAPR